MADIRYERAYTTVRTKSTRVSETKKRPVISGSAHSGRQTLFVWRGHWVLNVNWEGICCNGWIGLSANRLVPHRTIVHKDRTKFEFRQRFCIFNYCLYTITFTSRSLKGRPDSHIIACSALLGLTRKNCIRQAHVALRLRNELPQYQTFSQVKPRHSGMSAPKKRWAI